MKMREKAGKRLNLLETALLLGLAVFLISGAAALRTQDCLADKIVRLHVIAHSDLPEDQGLKLRVRDAVLKAAADLLEDADDRHEAEQLLCRSLPELEHAAEQVVSANGFTYTVRAELAATEFPTREYDGFMLPAGEYLALRIIIGEGNGQNWWCVVFPPLCSSGAMEMSAAALGAGLSAEEIRLISEESGYVLKFKTVEFWEQIRQKFT